MYQGKITSQFQFKKPKKLKIDLPNPNGILMLVRMLDVNDKTKSGLQLDSITQADTAESFTIGLVESLGSLCYKHDRFEGKPYCKAGDYVMFGRFQGIDFEFQGVRLKFLQDDKPITTFTEQQLLDLEVLVKDEEDGK